MKSSGHGLFAPKQSPVESSPIAKKDYVAPRTTDSIGAITVKRYRVVFVNMVNDYMPMEAAGLHLFDKVPQYDRCTGAERMSGIPEFGHYNADIGIAQTSEHLEIIALGVNLQQTDGAWQYAGMGQMFNSRD